MDDNFDVIVIGAGPGGYACAIKAAQLGMRVACVEKNDTLGGTCLNIGCIPSKALLHTSDVFSKLKEHGDSMGIMCSKLGLDLQKMMAFKEEAIVGNTKGVAYLFKKNNIHLVKGIASLKGAGHVHVKADNDNIILRAKHVVLATGSQPAVLPHIIVDEKNIVTSTGALSLSKVPETLAIIGGGVIGIELGTVWSRLGSKIVVIEYSDRILSSMDGDISKTMQRFLEKKGWQFLLRTSVDAVTVDNKKTRGEKMCTLTLQNLPDGQKKNIEAQVVLVATGRRPCLQELGLEKTDVALQERGFVTIRPGSYQTTLPGVYAIGDAIGGAMLAHKAIQEGEVLAEYLCHQRSAQVNYGAIPSVVYTMPEVASVGLTQEEVQEKKLNVKIGLFPLTANGRAKAIQETDGFVKIIADAKSDRVLGAHIIAPSAGEMIHEIVADIDYGGSSEDIARRCHAHPTFSEAIKEAALSVTGKPLHM